jgi:hypothetical protein
MIRRLDFWELTACGAAVGGTGVWGLAAAARVGWLRAFLDLFPRSSWDALTWVLIPVLLVLSPAAQGAIVARLAAPRPAPVWRGVAGSMGGTLVALVVASALALALIRRLPPPVVGMLARTLPQMLILGCGGLLVGGWLLGLGRLLRSSQLRRAAFPIAVLIGGAAWLRARGWVLAAAYVLDRAEVVAFFLAVAFGGAFGAAWSVQRAAGADLTGPDAGGYNVRTVSGPMRPGESGEGPFPSMVRK